MASFKPIDPKRDEFRRYLERTGVIEALTKVFVRLIRERERPADPLLYLRNNLGDQQHEADSISYLQGELAEAHTKIERLREIIERIDPEALQETQVNVGEAHTIPTNANENNNPFEDGNETHSIEGQAETTQIDLKDTNVVGENDTAHNETVTSENLAATLITASLENCQINNSNSSTTAQSAENVKSELEA